MDNGIGEKEFFDYVKRINQLLLPHQRGAILTIIREILNSPATFRTKKIKFVDRTDINKRERELNKEASSMDKISNLLDKATEIQKEEDKCL